MSLSPLCWVLEINTQFILPKLFYSDTQRQQRKVHNTKDGLVLMWDCLNCCKNCKKVVKMFVKIILRIIVVKIVVKIVLMWHCLNCCKNCKNSCKNFSVGNHGLNPFDFHT